MSVAPSAQDDRRLWDTLLGMLAAPAVLVAYDKGVFALLAEGAKTAAEICEAKQLASRPADAILAVLTSANLLSSTAGRFELTPLSKAYLLPQSPTFFGGFLEMLKAVYPVYSFESLKQVAASGAPVAGPPEGGDIFDLNSAQAQMAAGFTRAMHGMSVAPAQVWPTFIDLSRSKTLVDVGGGSGVHSIAAVSHWPELKGVIVDMPSVCNVAREFIAAAKVESRLTTHTADMWKDELPKGDVHFYGSVFHDWPLERCEVLAARSFAALPSGGRILLHEMLLNDDKSGPASVAAFSVSMLFGTQGRQYSALELTTLLRKVGFGSVEVKPTFGYWSVVSATKP